MAIGQYFFASLCCKNTKKTVMKQYYSEEYVVENLPKPMMGDSPSL